MWHTKVSESPSETTEDVLPACIENTAAECTLCHSSCDCISIFIYSGKESGFAVFHRGNTHMLLKEFSKCRLIGKMQHIRNLLNSGLRGFQQNFSLDDQGVVNPFISRFAGQFFQDK